MTLCANASSRRANLLLPLVFLACSVVVGHGALGNPDFFRDPAHTLALGAQLPDPLHCRFRCERPREALPLRPGPRKAGVDALDDDRALELREHAEHLVHRPARRGAGVEPLLGLFSVPAWADGNMVKAEVVKVDKSAGKITLKHGPIKNLDMDAMTMVFRVAEPAMLDKVKEGDKIEFEADRVNGAITITKIGKGH